MESYYDDYFMNQIGRGRIKIFVGSPNQKGHGIGSFLGGIFRKALPYMRKGVQIIGKEAARAGTNILTDIASHNIPIKKAVRLRTKESIDNLKRKAEEKIDQVMRKSGYKKRKILKMSHSRKKRQTRKVCGRKIVKKRKVVENKKKVLKKKRAIEDIFVD